MAAAGEGAVDLTIREVDSSSPLILNRPLSKAQSNGKDQYQRYFVRSGDARSGACVKRTFRRQRRLQLHSRADDTPADSRRPRRARERGGRTTRVRTKRYLYLS